MRQVLTLCVVHDERRILLGLKKIGFGEGRWNGFGGKVEDGEGIEEAACRELSEEACIEADELAKHGILLFRFHDGMEMEVHVFRVLRFTGEPAETDEMRPVWFPLEDIPYDDMWPDDKYWLPLLLAQKKFHGMFYFDMENNLVGHELKELKEVR